MKPLVIEYVFEGSRRGYNFTSPTSGFGEETLKTIWRTAMPRGQGWGAEHYLGAQSLKCFHLDRGRVAMSEVTVTDLSDEGGRRGIRRAVIQVMRTTECLTYLQERLTRFPPEIRGELEKRPSFWSRKNVVDKSLPKLRGSKQVIFSRPYGGQSDWQTVEYLVLTLAISRREEASDNEMIVPFTTLALDYRDESRIVALPSQQTAQIGEISTITIP